MRFFLLVCKFNVFQVRGCQGAVLTFQTGLGNGEVSAVVMVLGYDSAFTNITFRDDQWGGSPITSYVQTPLLMSCDAYR